jgi:hypothetical protein
VAYGLLLLAIIWPTWLVYPAGAALVFANGWLLRNLITALTVYRNHVAKLEQLDAPNT